MSDRGVGASLVWPARASSLGEQGESKEHPYPRVFARRAGCAGGSACALGIEGSLCARHASIFNAIEELGVGTAIVGGDACEEAFTRDTGAIALAGGVIGFEHLDAFSAGRIAGACFLAFVFWAANNRV